MNTPSGDRTRYTITEITGSNGRTKFICDITYKGIYKFTGPLFTGTMTKEKVDIKMVTNLEGEQMPEDVYVINNRLNYYGNYPYEISDVVNQDGQYYAILSTGMEKVVSTPVFYVRIPHIVSFKDSSCKFTKIVYNRKYDMIVSTTPETIEQHSEFGLLSAYIFHDDKGKIYVDRLPKMEDRNDNFITCYQFEKA